MGRVLTVLALVAVVASTAGAATTRPLRLTSPAFANGATIPERYTCRGENLSPPLRWTAPPRGTRGFALELHDPDAPRPGGFTHWLGWGIPASARGLPTGRQAPVEGANGSGEPDYTGPCPPSGVHRYVFTLFALRAPLRLRTGADRAEFRRALRGKVLAQARLVGRVASA
jgi:Raf kinase inhibitor-like YbhB/YbcL family protein